MSKKRNARRRTRNVLLIVSMMLVVAMASVGVTVAWLTDTTGTITNTFTAADIAITLTETLQSDGTSLGTNAWTGQMVPGVELSKNPVVAVDGDVTDVEVYLFVKFEELNNPTKYLNYTSTLTTENGWTKLEGENIPKTVWYRTVGVNDTTKSWNLIAGDKVTVKNTLKKGDMANIADPVLKYTAYAIQTEGFENAADAWSEISNPTV